MCIQYYNCCVRACVRTVPCVSDYVTLCVLCIPGCVGFCAHFVLYRLGFSYGDKVNYQWSTGTVRSAVLSPWVTATSVNTLSTYYMVTPKVRVSDLQVNGCDQ